MSGHTSQHLPRVLARLRIVSDGTAQRTVIYDAAGDQVKWGAASVERIEIAIEPNCVVKAIITLGSVGLDVDADTLAIIC